MNFSRNSLYLIYKAISLSSNTIHKNKQNYDNEMNTYLNL